LTNAQYLSIHCNVNSFFKAINIAKICQLIFFYFFQSSHSLEYLPPNFPSSVFISIYGNWERKNRELGGIKKGAKNRPIPILLLFSTSATTSTLDWEGEKWIGFGWKERKGLQNFSLPLFYYLIIGWFQNFIEGR